MKIEIIKGINYIICEKCGNRFVQSGFGNSEGIICPKCGHGNILLADPDFFIKLFKEIPQKTYKKIHHVGIDKDKFYTGLQELLSKNKVYRYDIYEIDENPNFNYFAEILIEGWKKNTQPNYCIKRLRILRTTGKCIINVWQRGYRSYRDWNFHIELLKKYNINHDN